MLPPRTPRPFCQPKPSARSVPSLSVRPIRQTILVVPMSSTPNGPVRPCRGRTGSSGSFGGGSTRRDMSFMLASSRPAAGATHEAIAEPHVDRGKRAIEQRVLLLKLHQPIERRDLVSLRQHHIGAVVEPQVPAPLADAHRGDDALLQVGTIGQRVDQHGGGSRRARADDERKLAEFGDVLVGDDLAVAVDQHELALVLPDGERTAFLQEDDDGAGQPALDGGVLHPGQGFHTLARLSRPRSRGSDRPC